MDRVITPELRDAARRMRDEVNTHVEVAWLAGRTEPGFVAIRLSDGRSPDHTLYDNRRDAVRHCGADRDVFYVKAGRGPMSEREAILVLQMNRQAYANGVIFAEEHVETLHLAELNGAMVPNTYAALYPSNRAERRAAHRKGLIIPNAAQTN